MEEDINPGRKEFQIKKYKVNGNWDCIVVYDDLGNWSFREGGVLLLGGPEFP